MKFNSSYGNPTNFNYNFMKNNAILSQKNLSQITKSNSVLIQNKIDVNENPPAEDGRSRWGPSIWYLFHTLSYKIKEEEFPSICAELLDIIKIICKNLPCPSCAQHATEYFSLEDLENKYGSANTLNIIKNFMQVFQYKSQSFNMIANDMQRQRQIDLMKVWFNNNVQKFDN